MNKRVESIVVVLEGSSVDKFKGTVMEKALQDLLQTLNESVNFVKKFTDVSTLNRFFNNTDHQLQFQMLNMQLLQNTNDLNLALNINSVFDQQQDMIDRQDDLADIFSKLDDIALAMVKQQEELRHQKKYMEKEFKRKFDSFKFHLEQDVIKAQNHTKTTNIADESKLFLRIPYHDLECEQLIGQGGFADVYKGTWLSQRHRVAIKTIRITYLTENLKQSVLDEIAAMYKIRYDHVLSIFGACIEPNYYALIVEYMSLGSLFDVLHKKEHVLSWTDRWSIAFQMTKSVNYLHAMSIIHRDIKSFNFLMDITSNGYIVKISDFGLAKIRQETSRQTTECDKQQVPAGTLQWKAPELLKLSKPSKASDIYSLGVVFWELATGCVPYDELDEATISQGVKAGERLEIPGDIPSHYKSIISHAWSQDPSKRPTSQELIEQIMTASPDITKPAIM